MNVKNKEIVAAFENMNRQMELLGMFRDMLIANDTQLVSAKKVEPGQDNSFLERLSQVLDSAIDAYADLQRKLERKMGLSALPSATTGPSIKIGDKLTIFCWEYMILAYDEKKDEYVADRLKFTGQLTGHAKPISGDFVRSYFRKAK
jgi:hypothetical protein